MVNKEIPMDALEETKDITDIYAQPVTVGEKDMAGNVITKIYGQSVGQYIVYESNSVLRVSAESSIFNLYGNISPLITFINSMLIDMPSLQERAKIIKAKAILHVCAGEIDAGKAILNNFIDYAARIKNRKALLQYLFGSFILTLLILIISGVFLYAASITIESLSVTTQLMLAISMSVMGGFLSVLLSLKTLEIDNESGLGINVFGGMSRIMIAAIAGIAMLVLIKAEILFGFVNKDESIYGLLALCFLSGFSESLIPNALKKLEDSTMSPQK